MMNYTVRKSALVIVFLLVIAVSGRAQTAPTPEQVEFASVLGERIRAASKAEIQARNDQLEPAIALEKKLAEDRMKLATELATLDGRIETLKWAATNCPTLRPAAQQAWEQATQSSNQRLALLKKTNDELVKAHADLLEAEKAAAWQLGNGTQLISNFDYLYKLWRMDPPQYTWPAMSNYLIAAARAKKIKSKVTISTGDAPSTGTAASTPIKYQLVSGGVISSGTNSAPLQLDPGLYRFWIDKPGLADSAKQCWIFREVHSIDLKANECH